MDEGASITNCRVPSCCAGPQAISCPFFRFNASMDALEGAFLLSLQAKRSRGNSNTRLCGKFIFNFIQNDFRLTKLVRTIQQEVGWIQRSIIAGNSGAGSLKVQNWCEADGC